MADLGTLERAVMDELWAADEPLTVRVVVEAVNGTRAQPLAYTTVQTVADRLTAKGLLERTSAGRAWAYTPTVSREEHLATLMLEALPEGPARAATLRAFADMVAGRDRTVLREALAGRARR